MALPNDQTKRETVKKYAQELIANIRQQELLKLRAKEIVDAVKESELIDSKEFNLIVKAALYIDKVQEQGENLLTSVAHVELLGLSSRVS